MTAQTLTLWITTQVRVVFGAAHTTGSQYGQPGSQLAELALLSSEHIDQAFHNFIVLPRYLFSPLLCLLDLGPA